MLQLAIECSGFHGSVSVFQGTEPLMLVKLPCHQSSVQSLASAISDSLRPHATRPGFISITSGPGSFTGLRVGLTTAKMLGFSWKIPIVPVDTLEVLARQMLDQVQYQDSTILIPVLDAFRQQVFTAAWHHVSNETIVRLSPTQVVSAALWQSSPLRSQSSLESWPSCEQSSDRSDRQSENRIVIAGPGLKRYLPTDSTTAPQAESPSSTRIIPDLSPQADFVAHLGWKLFQEGHFVDANQLTANYVRVSAAEEKLPK